MNAPFSFRFIALFSLCLIINKNTFAQCNLTVTLHPDSTPCAGILPSLGSTVTRGTPPYSYLWANNSTRDYVCDITFGGSYCLTVTDQLGCSQSACANVSCNISVALNLVSGCLVPDISGTPPYSYQWSDGFTGSDNCSFNPSIPITLSVRDANGCVGFAGHSQNGCVVASMKWYSSFCSGLPAFYVDFVQGTGPFSYSWSTGDTTDYLCNPPSGTYCITVTDALGCTVSSCATSGCDLSVSVGGTLEPFCSDNYWYHAVDNGSGTSVAYVWSNGSTSQIIINPAPGNYCVTATDTSGCSASACGTANPPTCQLATSIELDTLTQCLNPVIAGGTPPYFFSWSNGSREDSLCNVAPGNYCLTVLDANGCLGTADKDIVNSCLFTSTQSALPASLVSVVFTASPDTSLQPAAVVWDFGDGQTDTAFQVTHIYDSCFASLFVTMRLIDSLGNNLCSYGQNIFINCTSALPCQANFLAFQVPNLSGTIDPLEFWFTDYSVYSPISYQWNFGDGNTSLLQNPVHTYSTAGLYTACLDITDTAGCTSDFCRLINAGVISQDMIAFHHHLTNITPGFPLNVVLSYYNSGTALMNGTVEYRYPAGTTFVSSSPAPIAHDTAQRLLTFNYSNSIPSTCHNSISINLNTNASLQLGTVAYDTMWVKPIAGDVNPLNNVSVISEVVVGSWDPNDKAVAPKGIGDNGEIPVNTETLLYRIRFQNTGSAPAQNVVIRDSIDSNIDITTLHIADASHDHFTQIIGNELVVTFHNIMLPDSSSNEQESHGYINVIVNLKPGLIEGTQIFNTAEIYFDFNEAVITNTVVNTLKEATGIRQTAGLEFSIMPNPAQDEILIRGNFSRHAQYEILNELGQVMLRGDMSSERASIPVAKLHAGIYFVKMSSSGKTGFQRLAVTE